MQEEILSPLLFSSLIPDLEDFLGEREVTKINIKVFSTILLAFVDGIALFPYYLFIYYLHRH